MSLQQILSATPLDGSGTDLDDDCSDTYAYAYDDGYDDEYDFDFDDEDGVWDADILGPEVTVPDRDVLAELPSAERTRIIEELVRQELGRVLRVPPADIETTGSTMNALGVGSIAGLQIQSQLEAALQVEVNLQQLLLANSAAELIDCLAGQLGPGDSVHARNAGNRGRHTAKPSGAPTAPDARAGTTGAL